MYFAPFSSWVIPVPHENTHRFLIILSELLYLFLKKSLCLNSGAVATGWLWIKWQLMFHVLLGMFFFFFSIAVQVQQTEKMNKVTLGRKSCVALLEKKNTPTDTSSNLVKSRVKGMFNGLGYWLSITRYVARKRNWNNNRKVDPDILSKVTQRENLRCPKTLEVIYNSNSPATIKTLFWRRTELENKNE